MSLINRLIGKEEPKLPVHQFMAALAEYKRGALAREDISAKFNLRTLEMTHLDQCLTNLTSGTISREVIHDVLILAERGLYTPAEVKNRLGI